MKIHSLAILFVIGFFSCNENKTSNEQNVGDIAFDVEKDNPAFEVCNERRVTQYYARGTSNTPAQYAGEKKAITNHFFGKYTAPVDSRQNGYITIRFIVNCKGETGRFRIQEMDFDYQQTTFNPRVKDQLLSLTQELRDWVPVSDGTILYDFYQYFTFKIKDVQLMEVLP